MRTLMVSAFVTLDGESMEMLGISGLAAAQKPTYHIFTEILPFPYDFPPDTGHILP